MYGCEWDASMTKMGSAASKSARTLPAAKSAPRPLPSWAGARAPGPGGESSAQRHPVARAAGQKDDNIVKDGSDPQLLAHLQQLGPVRVDHHMQTVRTQHAASVQHAFASRAQADADAAGARTPRNRLWGAALERLLEERQAVRDAHALAALGEAYNLDAAVLARLARVVNVPGVRAGGGEGETRVAEWREPAVLVDGPQ